MTIADLRKELLDARQQINEGHPEKAIEPIERALEDLGENRLLTTTQAKDLLDLGSVNTLKLLVRKAGLAVEMHGNRMMIPLRELERLQDSPLVRGLRASNRLHEESADLGRPKGLTKDELRELEESRPGTVPWSERS